MNNNKYFTAEKIFARLSKTHKDKMSSYSIGDIIEWCAEIEIEVIGNYHQFTKYENVPLTVIDGKAMLPCNIFRISDIYSSSNNRIFNAHSDGDKISFSEDSNYIPSSNEIIYINYIGIPVDPETGYPLLLKGHEQALYWGCLTRMYEEDYLTQNIHGNIYNDMTIRYETALNAADNGFRHHTRNDMKEYMAVVLNAIQKANRLPMQTKM